MKCFTSYQRFNADTINGETLVVTHRYTTFDTDEMDAYENNVIRPQIGSGVMMEFNPHTADAESDDKGMSDELVEHYTKLAEHYEGKIKCGK